MSSFKLIDTSSVATASIAVQFRGEKPNNFTTQIIINGTCSALKANLEGSLDGANWSILGTTSSSTAITNNDVMFHCAEKPVNFIRVNVPTANLVSAATMTAIVTAEKGS